MEFGFSELLLVLSVVVIIILVSVFLPARGGSVRERDASRTLSATEARDQEILRRRHSGFKVSGIVLIALGILLVLSAPSLIKAFFMSYIGGAIIVLAGLAFLFLARRS